MFLASLPPLYRTWHGCGVSSTYLELLQNSFSRQPDMKAFGAYDISYGWYPLCTTQGALGLEQIKDIGRE